MTRPPPVLRFERLWLGSTLAYAAGAVLSWDERRRMIAGAPALAGYEWLVPAGFALVLGLSLLLWGLAAHRRSLLARTGVVVMAALSALVIVLTLIGMASGRTLALPTNLLQLASSALGIAGAKALFDPGARGWFREPDRKVAQ